MIHLGATAADSRITIADEVWIVTALLHREHPDRADFGVDEIVQRAEREQVEGSLRPGFRAHVTGHCVANRPPSPNRSRILFRTEAGRFRLFRRGDSYDPGREGSRTAPSSYTIPSRYKELLPWFMHWSAKATRSPSADPLLDLHGSGRNLWSREGADHYVERLRKDWSESTSGKRKRHAR
jgi:hypothetical protein